MPEGAPYWDYSEKYGEDKWTQNFSVGIRQSPINILSGAAMKNAELSQSTFQFSTNEASFTCVNKGYNVSFKPVYDANEYASSVHGGPLSGPYCFEECHFHWGRNNNKGCEHEIDGQRFDAELHLVHRKKECEFSAALNRVNGLCVLGLLIEVEDDVDTPPFIRHLMTSTKNVLFKAQTCHITNERFNPYSLFQSAEFSSKYFTYEGSLTTPPLSECVRWVVFNTPVKVSRQDFECLQNIFAVEDNCNEDSYHDPFSRQRECSVKSRPKIGDNYRTCCCSDGRKVEKSF